MSEPEKQTELVRWATNSPKCPGGPEAPALPALLRHIKETNQRDTLLRTIVASITSSSRLPGTRPSRTLAAVGDAPIWFWQELLGAARSFTLPHQKAAVLASSFAGAARVSWQGRGGDCAVGPAREFLDDLPRPELLTVIGGLANHIKDLGGERALQEAIDAVEDITRWWP